MRSLPLYRLEAREKHVFVASQLEMRAEDAPRRRLAESRPELPVADRVGAGHQRPAHLAERDLPFFEGVAPEQAIASVGAGEAALSLEQEVARSAPPGSARFSV